MRHISQNFVKEILDYDVESGIFTWKVSIGKRTKVGAIAGTINDLGYRKITIKGSLYRAHRLAWLYVHGHFPGGLIDHINGVRDDNRISNLRDATSSINRQNTRVARSDSKTGLIGVSWHEKTKAYRARITTNKKLKTIGYFSTPEAAHIAYIAAKRVLHLGNTL